MLKKVMESCIVIDHKDGHRTKSAATKQGRNYCLRLCYYVALQYKYLNTHQLNLLLFYVKLLLKRYNQLERIFTFEYKRKPKDSSG